MNRYQNVLIYLGLLLIGTGCVKSLTVSVPDVHTVLEFDPLNMTCVTDEDTAEVRWTKGTNTVADGPELLIDIIKVDDAGTYQCNALSPNGTASGTMNLVVFFQARWDQNETNKFGSVQGQPASLSCSVKALPSPQFYWLDTTGRNITASTTYSISSASANKSVLSISAVQQSQYGNYTCVTANSAGTSRFVLPLLTPGRPDSPRICQLQSVGTDSATVLCTPSYSGGMKADYVVYSSILGSKIVQAKSSWKQATYGDVTIDVTGLDSGTNYTLRVYATNQYGQSVDSMFVYLLTGGSPPARRAGAAGSQSELPAIIGGCVGGGVVVIICIILLVVCLKRRSKRAGSSSTSNSRVPQETKDTRRYVVDEENSRQFSRSNSWRSSKKKNKQGSESSRVQSSDERNAQLVESFHPVTPAAAPTNHSSSAYSDPLVFENAAYVGSSLDDGLSNPNPYNYNQYQGKNMNYAKPHVNQYQSGSYVPRGDGPVSVGGGAAGRGGGPSERGGRALERGGGAMERGPNAFALSVDQPSLAGYGALRGVPGKNSSEPSAMEQNLMNNHQSLLNSQKTSLSSQQSLVNSQENLLNYKRKPQHEETHLKVEPPQVKSVAFKPEIPWEFPRERLFIRQKIGEGSFGEVWQAKVEGILGRTGRQLVAVKMLKENYSEEQLRFLHRELDVMQSVQPHPNIIMLLGCCTRSNPLCLIMEFAPNGSLLGLLRRQRNAFTLNNLSQDSPLATRQRHINLTSNDLILFAVHVVSGMEYVASKQLIHRDLAARNVLIDDQLICKIADFGSVKDITEMRQYESKVLRRLPIRWMAPESLLMSEYSLKTDIWSYGILLWEIITLGSTPYSGLSGPQVLDFVQKGHRMAKPTHCLPPIYSLMSSCWSHVPDQRPNFSSLKRDLSGLMGGPTPSTNDLSGLMGGPTPSTNETMIFVDQMLENALEIIHNQPGEKC